MSKKSIPDNTMAAGNPIKIIDTNIQWNRDILNSDEIFETRHNERENENHLL
jgi:hypothetical protein